MVGSVHTASLCSKGRIKYDCRRHTVFVRCVDGKQLFPLWKHKLLLKHPARMLGHSLPICGMYLDVPSCTNSRLLRCHSIGGLAVDSLSIY